MSLRENTDWNDMLPKDAVERLSFSKPDLFAYLESHSDSSLLMKRDLGKKLVGSPVQYPT